MNTSSMPDTCEEETKDFKVKKSCKQISPSEEPDIRYFSLYWINFVIFWVWVTLEAKHFQLSNR